MNQSKVHSSTQRDEYRYHSKACSHSHHYLLPVVNKILEDYVKEYLKDKSRKRIFELGCGNGSVAKHLSDRGWNVTAIDTSESGIKIARDECPHVKFQVASAYDDLQSRYGQYPVVVSLEVIEHLYSPRIFARNVFQLLEPGGIAIISTPYHGYFKNLVLALSGKMDSHFTALWDHGHIKFWSRKTLSVLLREANLEVEMFERVGRVPILARSMIALAKKSTQAPL